MNLTQLSRVTRIGIALFVVFLIVYFIGYFSWPFLVQTYSSLFPKKEKPVITFGSLPKIAFESLEVQLSSPEYVLSTENGRLPNITPEVLRVYPVKKPVSSFLSGKSAQRKAAVLSFSDNDLTSGLTGSVYRWNDQALGRQLEINISTNTLDYSVDLTGLSPAMFATGTTLTNKSNQGLPSSLLASLGYFVNPLYNQGTQHIVYGKFENGRVVETLTPQELTFAKVDYFRSINKLPIYGPRIDDGLIEVIYGLPTSNQKLKYLKVTAHEWDIESDPRKIGSYPPLSVEEAWKKVTNGEGAVAKAKLKTASAFEPYAPVTISKIFIEKINLAYYDSLNYQEFLQPIYVFRGTFLTPDNQSGVIALYIQAVDPKHLKN